MEEMTGEFGKRMNSIGKYVASTTLTSTEWNATLLEGDVPEAVAKLKESDQTLMIAGSAKLVESLRAADLIDEYRLMIYPVVTGSGNRLFGSVKSTLTLAGSRSTESGVIIATYVPA
jgi:dihydrofolate reductase